MIMVQKAAQLPTPPAFLHRRAPSAPIVVAVHPTKTPGLLSLSKPPAARPTQPRVPQAPRQRSPKGNQPNARSQRSPRPAHAKAQSVATDDVKKLASEEPALTPFIESQPMTAPAATPERSLRGRQQAHKAAKDKSRRSASNSSPASRHPHHAHQPSPTQPSQAEAPNHRRNLTASRSQSFVHRDNKADASSFDPFLSNSSSDEAAPAKQLPVRQTPKLTARPSGKLARRRQVPESPTPASAKPIPVPTANANNRQATMTLSRSAPTQAAARPVPRRSTTVAPVRRETFPVCDDTTDTEDDSPLPMTPVRGAAVTTPAFALGQAFDDGPRTAPLATAPATFFGGYSSPCATPSPRGARAHRRAPSAGHSFGMSLSFDEDFMFGRASPVPSKGDDLAQMLFGLLPSPNSAALSGSASAQARRQRERRAQELKDEFFASSQFQNSPSPEDLPTPAF